MLAIFASEKYTAPKPGINKFKLYGSITEKLGQGFQ
jgi:hypothetical protein